MSRLQLSARPLLYTSVILTGSRSAPNACLPCLNVRLFAKTTAARHDGQTPTANHANPQQLSKGDATNKIENDEIEYPWWFPSGAKRPAHLVRLLDEFDARVQETKTLAQTLYGEHPSDKARRLRTENAPFAPKIYTVHGDDVQSFLGYNRDFFLRSSMKEVDGKLQEIFTMKVRKWNSIPRSNRRNERRGFKLTWSDFRILVISGLKVSKFATRRNRVRRVIHYGLKKHLPEHGKPGHDYFVLPRDSAVQISRQELEDRVLECMKAVHSLMDRKNGKSEVLRRPSAPTRTGAHRTSRMSGENRPKIPISRTSNKETENRPNRQPSGNASNWPRPDRIPRTSNNHFENRPHRQPTGNAANWPRPDRVPRTSNKEFENRPNRQPSGNAANWSRPDYIPRTSNKGTGQGENRPRRQPDDARSLNWRRANGVGRKTLDNEKWTGATANQTGTESRKPKTMEINPDKEVMPSNRPDPDK